MVSIAHTPQPLPKISPPASNKNIFDGTKLSVDHHRRKTTTGVEIGLSGPFRSLKIALIFRMPLCAMRQITRALENSTDLVASSESGIGSSALTTAPTQRNDQLRENTFMAELIEKPIGLAAKPTRSQEFYDNVKRKFAEERDLRLNYRPTAPRNTHPSSTVPSRNTRLTPYAGRGHSIANPSMTTVEVLFIGGGFSALLTSARLREHGRREHSYRRARRRRRAAPGTGIATQASPADVRRL